MNEMLDASCIANHQPGVLVNSGRSAYSYTLANCLYLVSGASVRPNVL